MTNQISDATLDRLLTTWTAAVTSRGLSGDLATRLIWKTVIQEAIPSGLDKHRVGSWFGVEATLPFSLLETIRSVALPVELLGAAFERTANQRLTGTAKRDAGMYFTPAELAELSAECIVAAIRSTGVPAQDWRILDPAAGGGAFAHALIEHLNGELPEEYVLTHVLRLVDVDPLAVAVARGLLLARFGSGGTDLDVIERHIVCGDSVVSGPYLGPASMGFDWVKQFPDVMADGGFCAVVGNPPWGTIKPSIREYAASVAPELLTYETSDMRALLKSMSDAETHSLTQERRAYSTTLRRSGYVLQGTGDSDFYKFFIELAHSLLRPAGVIGMLVPSALQRAAGASLLRKMLLDDGSFEVWLDFINSRAMFDIHRMFRFSLVVWKQGTPHGIRRVAFRLKGADEARRTLASVPVSLSQSYMESVSPTLRTIPEVRTEAEAELYARLHQRFPALGQSSSSTWNVRFRREVDMTNDVRLFLPRLRAIEEGAVRTADGSWVHPDRGVLLPLYEGRMVHQFDAAAKAHVDGHGRSARWRVLAQNEKQLQPRYLIAETDAAARGVPRRNRAAFCDITGHANERTILAALIPSVGVCGNKVPTCEFDSQDPDVEFIWLAIANSFVIDWVARRRVSTTLNFFHWRELPFARVDPASEAGRILVEAARRLSVTPARSSTGDAAERARLRTQIDVTVALLYGLNLLDLALIMRDFPMLDRAVVAARHRTVTRDSVLAGLAVARGMDDANLVDLGIDPPVSEPVNLVERVRWHTDSGAFGYIPGEHVSPSA